MLPSSTTPVWCYLLIDNAISNPWYAPKRNREAAWTQIAEHLDLETLETNTSEINLDDAIQKAIDLIEDKLIGRVVVNMKA